MFQTGYISRSTEWESCTSSVQQQLGAPDVDIEMMLVGQN